MLLGDWIATTTEKLGLPACFQCKNRQAKLNEFHKKMKAFFSFTPGSSGSDSSSSASPL